MFPLTVTIVDDDAGSRGATASLVRSLGLPATTFEDAGAFLASAVSSTTACLVTDIHMPGIGGLELLERFRILRPDCPVIVVSGFLTPAVREMAMARGAAAVFAKPLDDQFLACVETACGSA